MWTVVLEEKVRAVSEGLATTFRVLTETPNKAAVRALVAALDSPFVAVRRRAIESLIARQTPCGKREVLARIDQLDVEGLTLNRSRNAERLEAIRARIFAGLEQADR